MINAIVSAIALLAWLTVFGVIIAALLAVAASRIASGVNNEPDRGR